VYGTLGWAVDAVIRVYLCNSPHVAWRRRRAGGATLAAVRLRVYVFAWAATLATVVAVATVDELTVDEGSNGWRLGYQDALPGGPRPITAPRRDNPLRSVPEANWADLIDQRVDRCEDMWESNADSGGP